MTQSEGTTGTQETNPLAGKTVLVTGASGFLGTHLCRRLRERGAQPHAISRSPRATGEDLVWWQGDLTDLGRLHALYKAIRPHIVYHLASHGVGSPSRDLVLPTFHNDLQTLVNLLTVAAELGCERLVSTASLEEPEGDEAPASPYAAAKTAGTLYARMFHSLYSTPIVLLRPFMTYGPGQKEHKLIPYVTRALLQGTMPKLGSGTRGVDWVYVDDVIDAFLAAARATGLDASPIDLGTGVLVPIRDVVQQLTALVGGGIEAQFGSLPDRPQEKVRAADTLPAQKKLGWTARTPLQKGLDQTVDWCRMQLGLTPLEPR